MNHDPYAEYYGRQPWSPTMGIYQTLRWTILGVFLLGAVVIGILLAIYLPDWYQRRARERIWEEQKIERLEHPERFSE